MKSWRWGIFAITSVCLLTIAGVMPVLAGDEGQVVPVRLQDEGDLARINLLNNKSDGLTLQLQVPVLETGRITIGDREFDSLSVPGGEIQGDPGQPALPVVSSLVALPSGMTLQVSGLSSQKTTLDGTYLPVPDQGLRSVSDKSLLWDRQLYAGEKAFGRTGNDIVEIGEPALIRGQRVVSVVFHPVSWDPSSGRVEVITDLTASFSLVPSDDGNNPDGRIRVIPESFATLFSEAVLGYEKGLGQETSLGTWLIIYPPVSGVLDAITPLMEWRQRQGYNVIAASTGSIGTSNSSIKSYIQDQYNTLEIPLEFVTLAGDANGSVAVASWHENLSGYSGEGDHEYTRLEGNDVLADIHIGRLSATSASELTTVVNKIVEYESAPFMTSDLGWFTRAGLTGDPGSSGYSTIWVNQWVKEQLLDLNYTQIDTIWGGNFVNGMMATINQGETIFCYRGYWGMSGMNSGHISGLNNHEKLPFALVLTCDTGSFWSDTTCRSEAFLRAPGGGGVASVGTATTGTHTRYNNCMFQGIAEGVLNSGDPRVGPGLTRGKLHLYNNYIDHEPDRVTIWSTWNNLMGDPATPLWSAVPADLTVDYPSNLSLGANALPVTVTSGGQPVAGARVALYLKDHVQVNGLTDESGRIVLPLDSLAVGNLLVTVTGRNLRPHLGGVNIGNLSAAIDYAGQGITDDGTGLSSGNGDGLAAPGETVEVALQVVNNGSGGASSVTATLNGTVEGISVVQGSTDFGYISASASDWGDAPLVLTLDSSLAGGQEIPLELNITSGSGSWTQVLPLQVHGPAAAMGDIALDGVGNGRLDPGETGTMRVGIVNDGDQATSGVTAVLSTDSPWVTVLDPSGTYGSIPAGGNGTNSSDMFSVSAVSDCYPGHLANFTLDLTFAEGGTARLEFQLTVGAAVATDPVGPDRYGYLAFDNTDTGYDLAPTYDWVEIDPSLGGSGTSVGLNDFSQYQDDTRTINLPFDFSYYGHTFDQVSVCSNGWLAMGATYLRHFRNWTIPSAGCPDNMIAAFWDDLRLQSGTGGVFYWHDVANHRFIVEWSRVRHGYSNDTETFQVLLYDPAEMAGDTGDGVIVVQYQTVHQADSETGYATAGIQNEDRDDGVLYTYYNSYPGGAATLQSGRAIAYRTVLAQVQGVLKGTITNASAGGTPVDGATVTVLGSGRSFLSSVAGLYQGGVPEGTYDVAVSHSSFAPDTTYGVQILEGVETVVDFQITDIAGPDFDLTGMPENTDDTAGPYTVTVDISDYSGIQETHFYYTSSTSGGPFEVSLVPGGGDTFTATIPGQADGSRVQYWLTGEDVLGHASAEPAGAPYDVHSFVVTSVSEIYATDMETADGWTGGLAGDSATTGLWTRVDPNGVFEGSTDVQPEDDHTPSGTMCWITGNDPAGSNQGADDVDGGLTTLETPVFDVSGMSGLQVSYYRWYTNDTGQNPGSDFWRVQVSTGDGSWVNLEDTSASDRSWRGMNFLLEDYLALGDHLVFRFLAEDAGYGSVVEAGVDDFTLVGYNLPGDSAAPEVALTSFSGGQVVAPGSSAEITWTQSDDIGVVQVEILLSTDSGANWDTVVASGPLNGSLDWTVPTTSSSTCRLKVVCHDAVGNASEAVSGSDFTIDDQSPVNEMPGNRLALAQNAPNPFNPRTEIKFSLPKAGAATLKIYNVEGRLVRTLLSGRQEAGVHTVVWAGDDDRGGRVASGLYFYRLTTDTRVLTRKMTLLK